MPTEAVQAYPDVRLDRGAAITPVSAPAPQVKGTCHVWPFRLDTQPLTRDIIVSPAYPGPAFIVGIYTDWPASGNNTGGLSLFYSLDGSGGRGLATTVVPTGTPIFDPIGIDPVTVAQELDEVRAHLSGVIAAQTIIQGWLPLYYFVPVNDAFFLKLSSRAGAGVESPWKGAVVLYTGVDPGALPFL